MYRHTHLAQVHLISLFSSADGEEGTASSGIKSSIGLSILVVGIVGITVIVLVATFTWFRLRTRESFATGKDCASPSSMTTHLKSSNDSLSEESACLKLPVREIYSATNNLCASNFIGQGIAGKVYKGILSNGQHVAVKHILNDGYMDTFVREVTSLSHVRHPNLVALLGCCENEDECFLVYDLCHNGNLSEWLFGKTKVLSWMQRVEIAIDSARGLWFLHTYPEGCIVHRDIKPANILLNANFEARLSDFGLSKVMDVDQSHVSSEVRGTFGYVDPEYRKNHHVNASGDVYSFGIVLLQLLSGKRVINLDLTRPMPLYKMARSLTRGADITEFADPKLNGEYSEEAFGLILKLALSCTGLKQQRPSIEQVVSGLEEALEISKQVKLLTTRPIL
ncbi:probable receptor-like protein kinase At5g59700 [Juglans microcarpa x Juglans regia]|uniref:probable receptor-like protein kinase At5g59700 n=1 Tax=Juglans microcarpa x Juglans regia TaxID=2249226 RepID=UPI001B7EE4B9|nr:probable receptor-like protein kinase At5g59700 [Juglans microcarpa x Juglans regia]